MTLLGSLKSRITVKACLAFFAGTVVTASSLGLSPNPAQAEIISATTAAPFNISGADWRWGAGQSSPVSMVGTADGRYLFANDYASNAISRADTSLSNSVTTISGVTSPSDLAMSPDESFVLAANYTTGRFTKILVSNNSTSSFALGTGSNPLAVAINPAGTFAYFIEQGTNTLEKVDLATNTVTASLSFGAAVPSDMVLSPDGTTAWVASRSPSAIYKVTTSSMSLAQTYSALSTPQTLAIAPDNSQLLYTSHDVSNRIYKLIIGSGASSSVSVSGSGRPLAIAVDPQSQFAFVGGYGHPSMKVDLSTGDVSTFTQSGSPEDAAFFFPRSGSLANKFAFTADISTQSLQSIGISPSAPSPVTGTRGNAQVSLSWTTPTYPGADTITDYTIQYSTNNSTWSSFPHAASTGTTATVTGLTNGTPYYFRVAGISASGTGLFAYLSGTLTPATIPGAPSSISASPGATQLAVSWTAPASNGGAAITDYVVEYSTNNTSWTIFSHTASAATNQTITGLTNGTPYYVRVSATNAVGTGPTASAGTWAPTAGPTVPGPPTNITGTTSSTQLVLSWTAPSSDGGSPITDYIIEYSTDNASWTSLSHTASTATTLTLTGLTNGTSYYTRISATNAIGTGAYGSGGPWIPSTIPGAPTLVTATTASTQLIVTWAAPSSDGGSAITDYVVEYSTDNSTWSTFSHPTSTALTQTITGLTDGTAYYVRVSATNAIGAGPYGSAGPWTYSAASSGGGGGGCTGAGCGGGTAAPEVTPITYTSPSGLQVSTSILTKPNIGNARVIYRMRSTGKWEVVPRFRVAARTIPRDALFTVVRSPISGQSKNIPAALSRAKLLATSKAGFAYPGVLKGKLWRGTARIIVNW